MKQRDKSTSPGRLLLFLGIMFTLLSPFAHGQTLPTNFQRVLVTGGLSRPAALAFTPDGRILISNQGGQLRVFKNGALLPTPALSLTVNSDSERGLIGVAVDPNFNTNKFIYVYYTHTSGPHNRVSRFTLNGDVASGEVVLLDLPNLGQPFHNGGGIVFGKDGKLYVPVGDNKNNSSVQNLDSYWGKVLRINADGSVPADNPFPGGAVRSRVWALGLRNPWTSGVDPVSGKIFINDVGENEGGWEEVNDASVAGRNFGWPNKEGKCTSGCTGFTDPVYTYQIARSGAPVGKGCAINGGTFLNGAISNYPAQYHGKYFFHDYCNPWIDYINPVAGATRNGFGSALGGGLTNIEQGTDGNLYFINRDNNSVYKIIYTGTQAPVIGIQPQNISVPQGQDAVFTVTASGNPTPTYQWRKGTANIAGATAATYTIPNVQPSHAGQYNVVVSNSAGSVTSNNATLTVTAPNTLPVATIVTPANGSRFRAGDVINFSGSATDAEDGTLPASAYEWWAVFHHANHNHSGPQIADGVTSGSFPISVEGHTETDIWYRIYLAVKDSRGESDTAMIEIFPVTSNLTIQTEPAGLQLNLDNIPKTAPYSTPALSGMIRPLTAISPQVLNGVNYIFDRWEHGGNASQNITITDNDAVYKAVYKVAPAPTVIGPVQDAYVRDGSNAAITHGTTDPTLLITKIPPAGQLNNAREAYLTFDISSLPANLSSVKLRVFGNIEATSVPVVPVGVYSVANTAWSETALTWNNKPATGASPLSTTEVSNGAGKYYEWDVTGYVSAEKAAGRTLVSLALKSQQAHDPRIFFNSKEATANAPQLSAIGGGTGGPACVPATASGDDGNVAANVLDNDLNTRWSASGDGQWIQLCLSEVKTVTGVDIAFYKGDTRRSRFDILTSTDGNAWNTAAANVQASGTSLAFESFNITATTAKYVRIVGHGNDQNAWNSYNEIKVKTTAAARTAQPGISNGKPSGVITQDDLRVSPNPFGNTLAVTFRLREAGRTQLSLFDLSGKQAGLILNTNMAAGEHRATYNTTHLAPGVYILQLRHNGTTITQKAIKE